MSLYPSRETLTSDASFADFYGELRNNPRYKTMLGVVREELADAPFDSTGLSGMESRALRDAMMEGVEMAIKLMSDFNELTPPAVGQSDISGLMIEDQQKESE